MSQQEVIQFQNKLGMVTSKKVILKYKTGEESISLSNITSIGYRHQRNLYGFFGSLIGAVGVLAGMLMIIDTLNGPGTLLMVGLILVFALAAIANWVGRHYITLQINGRALKPFKIEMSKSGEGKELYLAIDKALP